MPESPLSDAALSILAFAAYHALESGEAVTKVVLDDRSGHHADAEGVRELTAAGLLEADGERGTFTATGREHVGRVIAAIRGA